MENTDATYNLQAYATMAHGGRGIQYFSYNCRWNGVLCCYETATGKRLYQQRLGGGAFTASPVAGDGKIYIASEDGDVFVVKAGPNYELIAKNSLGEVCLATPAISQGLLLFRTQANLHAIAGR